MEKIWIKIIAATGSVGVLGLLFSFLMNHLFNAELIKLLGSEKLFFILVLLIFGFITALLLAIMKPKSEQQDPYIARPDQVNKKIDITYDGNSTHNGDINF